MFVNSFLKFFYFISLSIRIMSNANSGTNNQLCNSMNPHNEPNTQKNPKIKPTPTRLSIIKITNFPIKISIFSLLLNLVFFISFVSPFLNSDIIILLFDYFVNSFFKNFLIFFMIVSSHNVTF